MKDLDLKFEVIDLAPLKLSGRCGEVNFIIVEVDDVYMLSGSDGSLHTCLTLKGALQDCYLNWR